MKDARKKERRGEGGEGERKRGLPLDTCVTFYTWRGEMPGDVTEVLSNPRWNAGGIHEKFMRYRSTELRLRSVHYAALIRFDKHHFVTRFGRVGPDITVKRNYCGFRSRV